MTEPVEEGNVRKIYRDFLAAEAARPEIRRDKEKFIAHCFRDESPAFFSPGFLIPAFALLAVCLFFSHLQEKFIPRIVRIEDFPGMRIVTQEEVPARPSTRPPVHVKRVASRAGATLVYQKVFDNHELPITIIWVFPGGKNQ